MVKRAAEVLAQARDFRRPRRLVRPHLERQDLSQTGFGFGIESVPLLPEAAFTQQRSGGGNRGLHLAYQCTLPGTGQP